MQGEAAGRLGCFNPYLGKVVFMLHQEIADFVAGACQLWSSMGFIDRLKAVYWMFAILAVFVKLVRNFIEIARYKKDE